MQSISYEKHLNIRWSRSTTAWEEVRKPAARAFYKTSRAHGRYMYIYTAVPEFTVGEEQLQTRYNSPLVTSCVPSENLQRCIVM